MEGKIATEANSPSRQRNMHFSVGAALPLAPRQVKTQVRGAAKSSSHLSLQRTEFSFLSSSFFFSFFLFFFGFVLYKRSSGR